MKKAVVHIILIFLLSCRYKEEKEPTPDHNFDIVIQNAFSTKVDFAKKTYIIYYSRNSTTEAHDTVKFNLSASEYLAIKKEFIEKGLNRFTDSTIIEDKCMVMPKTLTKIVVSYPHQKAVISIDRNCTRFNFAFRKDAKNIIEFLDYVDNIMQSKDEIRNAPVSNTMYL